MYKRTIFITALILFVPVILVEASEDRRKGRRNRPEATAQQREESKGLLRSQRAERRNTKRQAAACSAQHGRSKPNPSKVIRRQARLEKSGQRVPKSRNRSAVSRKTVGHEKLFRKEKLSPRRHGPLVSSRKPSRTAVIYAGKCPDHVDQMVEVSGHLVSRRRKRSIGCPRNDMHLRRRCETGLIRSGSDVNKPMVYGHHQQKLSCHGNQAGVAEVIRGDRLNHNLIVNSSSGDRDRYVFGQNSMVWNCRHVSDNYTLAYFENPYCWGGFEQIMLASGWYMPYGFYVSVFWLEPILIYESVSYCPP